MPSLFCLLLFFFCLGTTPIQAASVEEVFSKIYRNKTWGVNEDQGVCGGGSSIKATQEYRQFLEAFFVLCKIKSVVDVGCGDWAFSKKIDWSGINYLGIDVVPFIIAENQKKFGNEHIAFIQGDLLTSDLPPADLLICKDVLQHLSNADVHAFIKQCPKYKYCLITNDVNPTTHSSSNRDISTGGSRKIDLSAPPFSVQGYKLFSYQTEHGTKQLFLIINTQTYVQGH